jgi:hypothetical protein
MSDTEQPLATSFAKDGFKLGRRMSHLGGIEAHSGNPRTELQRFNEGIHRAFRAEMAQEARNEPPGDPQLFASLLKGPVDAGNDRLESDASSQVGLGVEEDLGVSDTLVRGSLEIGHREVKEVELGYQDGAAVVVEIEERLEIVEYIGAAGTRYVLVVRGHAVANGELEHQLGFQRSFDVDVELGLR